MADFDFDDDLILLAMGLFKFCSSNVSMRFCFLDPLEDDEEYRSGVKSNLSNSDYQSIDSSNSNDFSNDKKMSDITDLLDRSVLDGNENDEENSHCLSTSIVDCLRSYQYGKDSNNSDQYQWQLEENFLKFGSLNIFFFNEN